MATKRQDFRSLEGKILRPDQGLPAVFQKRQFADYRNGWIYLWYPLIGGKRTFNNNRDPRITINCGLLMMPIQLKD